MVSVNWVLHVYKWQEKYTKPWRQLTSGTYTTHWTILRLSLSLGGDSSTKAFVGFAAANTATICSIK